MKIFVRYEDELSVLESYLVEHAKGKESLHILEAGCGREWYFKLQGVNYELTGIDLDADALRARIEDRKDLKTGIVGDLRTAVLPDASFDAVYNAFVLEHVRGAEQVLENLVRWLKPGGLLIVRVPDKDGVQGFLARMTPHIFHVWYYRWAWKMKDAGKPGFAPYPTIYDHVISRKGLRAFCATHDLEIVDEIGVGSYRRGYGFAAKVTPLLARIVSLATLGTVHARYVDRSLVARKKA